MLADLHTHSTESDGWREPAAVAAAVARHGVRVMALSDHDCVEGVEPAGVTAHRLGMAFVPAVEITTYPLFQLRHILGHGVDVEHRGLLGLLERNQRVWREQTLACLTVLRDAGVADPDLEALALRPMVMPNVLVRHLLMREAMGEQEAWGHVHRGLEAVPEGVYAVMPDPAEAVEVIHAAGGLAVGAHPGYVPDQDLMEETLPLLDGLEVYTWRHSAAQIRHYEELARRHDLPATVGTDFHGYLDEAYVPPAWSLGDAWLERLDARVRWPLGGAATAGGRPA